MVSRDGSTPNSRANCCRQIWYWCKASSRCPFKAIVDFDRAIELNPNFALAYYQRGNAYRLAGHPEQAMHDYDTALKLNPGEVEAYYNRGIACADAGDLEQAILDFEQYIALAPDAPNWEKAKNAIEDLKSELAP